MTEVVHRVPCATRLSWSRHVGRSSIVPAASGLLGRAGRALRRLDEVTRPIDPERRAIMAQRWDELPDGVKTPNQLVGRFAIGCEGTHGVFPKCDLTCSPCYHSSDANKVRIDGSHTLREVAKQMAYLRKRRGSRAHAQLIGGEVSLLSPDDHAATLLEMRAQGREPMSMTHGDFDYDYLRQLALGFDGRPRFAKLSFAAHFDSLMRGRQSIPRPRTESDLNPYRAAFVAMFDRLRREHGVTSYLAHNMTVTPSNLDQVAQVVRDTMPMGYSMLSFQPAAFVGDDRRWREGFREVTPDAVWDAIEAGAGTRLPHAAVQMGDPRCNRTAYGLLVGERWVPLLDDASAVDVAARDAFFAHLGGAVLGGIPEWRAGVKVTRAALSHPRALGIGMRYAARLVRRSGGPVAMVRCGVRPMTFVMHSFMDAADVAPAWLLLRQGVVSDDPGVRATQDRLKACVYTMAHPDSDLLVPACAQHSVFDVQENQQLRQLLPLIEVRAGSPVPTST